MKLAWYWKVGIVLVAVAFVCVVWPTRYTWYPAGNTLLRRDRLSGECVIVLPTDIKMGSPRSARRERADKGQARPAIEEALAQIRAEERAKSESAP